MPARSKESSCGLLNSISEVIAAMRVNHPRGSTPQVVKVDEIGKVVALEMKSDTNINVHKPGRLESVLSFENGPSKSQRDMRHENGLFNMLFDMKISRVCNIAPYNLTCSVGGCKREECSC